MEILKLILSWFVKEKNLEGFAPIIELLSKNSFDVSKTLKNLNLDTIAPIIKSFMERATKGQNTTPTENSVGGEIVGLNPIAKIADKEIVYTLNRYYA